MMELLLNACASAEEKKRRATKALRWAVQKESVAILKVLLAAGADPDVQDFDKMTVLQIAAKNPKETILEMLLKAGADPNPRGESPLASVLKRYSGTSNAVRVLLQHGADPRAIDTKYLYGDIRSMVVAAQLRVCTTRLECHVFIILLYCSDLCLFVRSGHSCHS